MVRPFIKKEPRPFIREYNPWTIADVSVDGWFDAADQATITSSSRFANNFADKSGGGNDIGQGTAGKQPETGVITLNGLNVLKENGNCVMANTQAIDLSQNLNVFMVGQRSTEIDNVYLAFGTNLLAADLGNIVLRQKNTTESLPVSQTTLNEPVLTYSLHNNSGVGSQFQRFENGSPTAQVSIDTPNALFQSGDVTTNMLFFDDSSGGSSEIAYIAEIVYIVGTITSTLRDLIEGYLAWKWGLQNKLHSGHFYKYGAPLK